ncbi:uncharacterized protein LTHEOB_1096 [Lasiodiplodia theobromae]|uniref:uncharacterized protein n=1 Tax=Lasiodiplodia theobromae TaxID=45133 RepID=UPI0015C33928|nr:uncharacterized protein LTHEOB_1096 [Lasiodiplodia theobromae]KAF4538742.1 hypothetical protein LTHEOB_1096 [Lasiodiplodia theobromae]
MTTPQDNTIFFVGMGPAPSSPSTIIVFTPSSTTTNNNQSAGPTTTGGPVYTPAASSLSTTTTSRKRKLAAAFGDDKQYRPTSWPGANAPAAAAAATATTAVAVAAAAAQEGFPLPKRRRRHAHARARPSARPTSAASCFADVDEAARGGPLGFARLMAGLPGGFEGHRSRTRGPDGGSGVVLGVVRGLPGAPPAVGPAGGLVFRMWPGREIRLGERGRRTGGVPAPLEWLVREREGRERVEREADEFLAGLEALEEGGRREEEGEQGEGDENWEWVGEWREETVAEGERMRREWERVRERVPNWAEALAAYR